MKAVGWRTDLSLSCGSDDNDPNGALTSTYLVVPSFVSIFSPFCMMGLSSIIVTWIVQALMWWKWRNGSIRNHSIWQACFNHSQSVNGIESRLLRSRSMSMHNQ
jgi:hypothetical protein